MPRGSRKRAAAAAAESKIKKVVEAINRDDDDVESRDDRGNVRVASTENQLFNFSGNTYYQPKQTLCSTVAASMDDDQDTRDGDEERPCGDHPCGADTTSSTSSSSISSVGDDFSIQTLLDGNVATSMLSSESIFMSSTMKAKLSHQRRRAARQVHSTGPMILSRRSHYRMSLASVESSPNYSPIHASRLSFSPLANLPTTPTFATFAAVATSSTGRPPKKPRRE